MGEQVLASLQEPPIPSDADLRHMPGYMIDVQALLDNDLAARGDPAANWFAVLTWCAALHQVPAGSLPDDDDSLAWIVRLGRDVKTWRKMRAAGALRGWEKHSDGRLYHPMVTEKVLELLDKSRKGRAGGLASAKSRKTAKNSQVIENIDSKSNDRSTDVENGLNQQTNKGREGKGREGKETESDLSVGIPDTHPETDTGTGGQLALIGDPEQSPAQIKASQLKADFLEWYAEYPKKVDPQDAEKAYLRRRRQGVSRDVLLIGSKGYAVEMRGTEKRFIKAPAVFLNKGSYENYPDGSPPNGFGSGGRQISKAGEGIIAEMEKRGLV